MKAYGGILAGGIGSRMQNEGGLPKQLIKVGGVPVLNRTIQAFLSFEKIDFIFVAMNKDWIDYARKVIVEGGIDRSRVELIEGGETRFDSLINLARASGDRSNGEQCVLINHDCARPFVSRRIISDCLEAMRGYDMVTTSIPTIDTVLISNDGRRSDSVPDRKTVFCDQGPQAFWVEQFLKLANSLTPQEKDRYMEAGRLYLDKNLSVGIVQGERTNFKLTTPFDMALAETMLKEGIIK